MLLLAYIMKTVVVVAPSEPIELTDWPVPSFGLFPRMFVGCVLYVAAVSAQSSSTTQPLTMGPVAPPQPVLSSSAIIGTETKQS